MARSLKKGPFVEPHLLEKIDKMNTLGREEAGQDLVAPLDGDARTLSATPSWFTTAKFFNLVFVTENMVGHKLGEFSPTRIFKKHGSHTAKVTK